MSLLSDRPADAPLARESLSYQAYHRLRRDLMGGRYNPGEKLKLRDIAEELGVSPTPVREALARLVSDMAVVQLDHRSVRVPHIDVERFNEICLLRAEMEGRAAERAAERATPAAVDELEAIHARLTALKNGREIKASLVENQRFHSALCALADLPLHYRFAETLWLQIGPLMNALLVCRPTNLPRRHPHRTILDGLRAGDGATARRGVEEDVRINAEPLLAYLRDPGAFDLGAAPDGEQARPAAPHELVS
ncbi:GntR family transcriptional regulator [Chelatococcus reniformis]|uniref:Transcriptional regulator n=1 Tax=Chelatococcus reniformis TaxID=1494448 RepID=A0A916TY33_9HYPH|nr:GntR family transcriptional regulator [Chelatococcus reniformis]GGC51936.1 transcriptional regulator [Chelatococcus reniformis]